MATTETPAQLVGKNRGATAGQETGRTIPILALGLSLSSFFVFSYSVCVLGYLLYPGLPIQHGALAIFLPGFTLLSWQSFFLGLVESFLWGWYVALVFGRLYNFFVRRVP